MRRHLFNIYFYLSRIPFLVTIIPYDIFVRKVKFSSSLDTVWTIDDFIENKLGLKENYI